MAEAAVPASSSAAAARTAVALEQSAKAGASPARPAQPKGARRATVRPLVRSEQPEQPGHSPAEPQDMVEARAPKRGTPEPWAERAGWPEGEPPDTVARGRLERPAATPARQARAAA